MTAEAEDILDTRKGDPDAAGRKWRRWYEVLNAKMISDDMIQVDEVVPDLSHARETMGISPALERMLSAGRHSLVSELVFYLDIDEEEAVKKVEQVLSRGGPDKG